MTFRLFHRINGWFLALFIVLHLVTHLSGLWGIETYAAVQNALRILYRNPVVEPVLLILFSVQVGIGLRLILGNFKRRMRETWSRVQAISGLILLLFIALHLSALAQTRWLGGLDTTFFWPAAVMSGAPFYWFFAPYYFAGLVAMFVHFGCAVRLMLLRRKQPRLAGRAFWALALGGVIIAAVINLMLLGAFYGIELPPEWQGYLQKYIPGYGA